MDAQRFIAEFGHITNAPNGIAKLRELVLVMAMQGKLVSQLQGETASELLDQIETEKRRYALERGTRPLKEWPAVGAKDASGSIPKNWIWVRFGDIAIHNSGKTLDSVRNRGVPRDYVTTSNLYWGRFDLSNVRKMLIGEDELERCTATKNDLLICEGGEAGRAAVWTADYDVCFQNHVHRARFFGKINPLFAYRYFEKLNATGEIAAHRKGIGISNLSSKALAMISFPLPPIEEQSRIVAKVDELMALCDALEQQQQDRRKLQNALRQSTLQAVAATTSPDELRTAWMRLSETFPHLFIVPDDLEEVRSLVLDLAIKGLLTISDGADEPVEHLIERSQAAKSSRLASGEMKRKAISATDLVQLDMPLPDHWSAVALDDLFQFIDYRGKTPPKTNSGVVLITAKNIRPRQIRSEPVEHISEASYKQWMTRGFPMRGDILFTTEAPLGYAAVIEQSPNFALAQRIICLQPFGDVNTRCAMYFMMSPTFQRLLEANSTGMTAKGIKAAKLKQLKLPLPPIGEQARIVEKVAALMRFCDELASQKQNVLGLAARLSIAAVSNLTGITIEPTEEPVKAPKTELLAPLHLGKSPGVKDQAPLATILAHEKGGLNAKDLWQRYGGEIDAFYAQLKTEVANGWIREPDVAVMNEIHDEPVSA